MWSLAASVSIGLSLIGVQATQASQTAWAKVQSSVAFLLRDGKPQGTAVLIDDAGYFIAHRTVVPPVPAISARLADGRPVVFALKAIDEQTQLVLLEASGWQKGTAPPIDVAGSKNVDGKPVLGVFLDGPVVGHCVSTERVGIIRPSLRYTPLSEVRFEKSKEQVGGGLVFTMDGGLVGMLSATLEPVSEQDQPSSLPVPSISQPLLQGQRYGPAGMTVAYTLGSDIMARVVEGFRSPERKVKHPAIGASFMNAEGQGALITSVVPGSTSESGGLRVGDIVTAIGDAPIRNQFDMAKALFRQSVGKELVIKIRRGDAGGTLKIKVGVSG